MGIKNLWQLLSPVGRSVSIETLSGKTLAVDVSIWLTQFIKAMRDDDGKVMKNAHIIGTLRRVVKLLFHRIRPVFVFDGGAPALKGRTLAARRKLKSDGTDSSMRKTAQRILASQLKKHKVAMSAAKRGSGQATTAAFNPVYQSSSGGIGSDAAAVATSLASAAGGVDSRDTPGSASAASAAAPAAAPAAISGNQGKTVRCSPGGDSSSGRGVESRAAAEEGGVVAIRPLAGVSSVGGEGSSDNDDEEEEDDDVDWEELEVGDGGGVLGAGRQALVDSDGDEVVGTAGVTPGPRRGAEGVAILDSGGGGGGGDGGDESAGWAVDTDDDDDAGSAGWEEVELPQRNEDIDPEVIASLPDRVKKQVIETAKRRQRMRSRAQYMPVAGNPAMYSQTQISNFLRSQKLNSQIMQVHKQDDGDREGMRIASEANRRYILTPALAGGGIRGGRGDGASNGSIASVATTEAGGGYGGSTAAGGRRRRRIADEGEEFKVWSYTRPSPPSPPRSKASVTLPAETGRGSEATANDQELHGRSPDAASGIEEEGGGFLPESDEEAGGFLPENGEEKVGGVTPKGGRDAGRFLPESGEKEGGGVPPEGGRDAGGFIIPESDNQVGGFLPESDEEEVEGVPPKGGRDAGGFIPESDNQAGGFLPESDEEAGGFLPESDEKNGSSAIAGAGSRRKGGGGGVASPEPDDSSRSVVLMAGSRKGKGRAGPRSSVSPSKRSVLGAKGAVAGKDAGSSSHVDRARKGKGRLQRTVDLEEKEGGRGSVHVSETRIGKRRLQRAGDTGHLEEEEEEEEGGGSNRRSESFQGSRSGSKSEAADDAIARKFQEEEDRRTALALQADLRSAADAPNFGVADSGVQDSEKQNNAPAQADTDLGPLRLLDVSRHKQPGTRDGGKSMDGKAKPTAVNGSPALPFDTDRAGGGGSGAGGGSSAGGKSGVGSASNRGDASGAESLTKEGHAEGDSLPKGVHAEREGAGFELEIDLKDLETVDGQSGLMKLFSSANAGLGSRMAAESNENSDESFDGFVEEEEEGSVGMTAGSREGPAASVTNEAALQRSVDMASRMAGWAGRVVERVLKEHRQPGAPAGSSSANAHGGARTHAFGEIGPLTTAGRGRALPATPIATGPAAAGAGSHAAAQAATDERRRLEAGGRRQPGNEVRRRLEGSGMGRPASEECRRLEGSGKELPASEERRRVEGSGKGRSVDGQSRRTLFAQVQACGEEIVGEGRGTATVAASAASTSCEPDSPAETTSLKPSGSTTNTGDVLSALNGKAAVGSSASEVAEALKRDVRETGAVARARWSSDRGSGGPSEAGSTGPTDARSEVSNDGSSVNDRMGSGSVAEGGRKAAVKFEGAIIGTTVQSAASSNRVVDVDEPANNSLVSPSVKTNAADKRGPLIDGKGTPAGISPKSGANPSPVQPGSRLPEVTGDHTAMVGVSLETRSEASGLSLSGPNPGAQLNGLNAATFINRKAAKFNDQNAAMFNDSSAMNDAALERSGEGVQEDAVDDAVGGTVATFQPLLPTDAGSGQLESSRSAVETGPRVQGTALGGGLHGGSDDIQRTAATRRVGEGSDELQGTALGGGVDKLGEFAGDALGAAYLGDMDEEELGEESERLRRESNRGQRDAETVTDEMKEEVMDLLKLFGIPYVVAPMEAEAQCCELERLRLVDGTVTDDSDAFAFGGRAVYKNIFNDKKFVEAYLLADAEKDIGVGTDEVIALALLLGSDYTEGVRGVGIVNAMEIINAFPLEGKGAYHGLSKFKSWVDGFDPVLDQKLEKLQKYGSKSEIDELPLEDKFHLKHRTARNRWTVSENFPSKEVIDAYKKPQVDKSEETFSWAEPDIDGLRALCQRVLGWNQVQSDGLLVPMIKELDRGSFSQPRIDRYFMTYHDNRRVAAIKSKRLRTAVEDLSHGPTEVLTVKGSAARAAIPTKRKKPEGKPPSSADMEKARRKASQESAAEMEKARRKTFQDSPGGKRQRRNAAKHSVSASGYQGSVSGSPKGRRKNTAANLASVSEDANTPQKPSVDSHIGKRRRKTAASSASSIDKDPLSSAEDGSAEPSASSGGDSDVSSSSRAVNASHEGDSVSIDEDGGPRKKRTRSANLSDGEKESVAGRSTRTHRVGSGKSSGSAAAAADAAASRGRSLRRDSAGRTTGTTTLAGDGGASNNRPSRGRKESEVAPVPSDSPVPAGGKRRNPRREAAKTATTTTSGKLRREAAASSDFGSGKNPLAVGAGGEGLGFSDDGTSDGGGGGDEDDDDDYRGSSGSESEDEGDGAGGASVRHSAKRKRRNAR